MNGDGGKDEPRLIRKLERDKWDYLDRVKPLVLETIQHKGVPTPKRWLLIETVMRRAEQYETGILEHRFSLTWVCTVDAYSPLGRALPPDDPTNIAGTRRQSFVRLHLGKVFDAVEESEKAKGNNSWTSKEFHAQYDRDVFGYIFTSECETFATVNADSVLGRLVIAAYPKLCVWNAIDNVDREVAFKTLDSLVLQYLDERLSKEEKEK